MHDNNIFKSVIQGHSETRLLHNHQVTGTKRYDHDLFPICASHMTNRAPGAVSIVYGSRNRCIVCQELCKGLIYSSTPHLCHLSLGCLVSSSSSSAVYPHLLHRPPSPPATSSLLRQEGRKNKHYSSVSTEKVKHWHVLKYRKDLHNYQIKFLHFPIDNHSYRRPNSPPQWDIFIKIVGHYIGTYYQSQICTSYSYWNWTDQSWVLSNTITITWACWYMFSRYSIW